MSTLMYAAMTHRRQAAQPLRSTSDQPPGVGTYVDALAALVPAEVLSVHAALLTFTTDTVVQDGKPVVTITEPKTLAWAFWALLLLSVVVYVAAPGKMAELDWARASIAPFAFVGWTMLQKATAFDAVAPGLAPAPRNAIAVIGAVVLGLAASALAARADRQEPPAPPGP